MNPNLWNNESHEEPNIWREGGVNIERWSQIPNASPARQWTKDEDLKLLHFIDPVNTDGKVRRARFPTGIDWKLLSDNLHRSPVECVKRYAVLYDDSPLQLDYISPQDDKELRTPTQIGPFTEKVNPEPGQGTMLVRQDSLQSENSQLPSPLSSGVTSPTIRSPPFAASPTKSGISIDMKNLFLSDRFDLQRSSVDETHALNLSSHLKLLDAAQRHNFNWEKVGEELQFPARECHRRWSIAQEKLRRPLLSVYGANEGVPESRQNHQNPESLNAKATEEGQERTVRSSEIQLSTSSLGSIEVSNPLGLSQPLFTRSTTAESAPLEGTLSPQGLGISDVISEKGSSDHESEFSGFEETEVTLDEGQEKQSSYRSGRPARLPMSDEDEFQNLAFLPPTPVGLQPFRLSPIDENHGRSMSPRSEGKPEPVPPLLSNFGRGSFLPGASALQPVLNPYDNNPFGDSSLSQSAFEEAFLDMAGGRLDASTMSGIFHSKSFIGHSRLGGQRSMLIPAILPEISERGWETQNPSAAPTIDSLQPFARANNLEGEEADNYHEHSQAPKTTSNL